MSSWKIINTKAMNVCLALSLFLVFLFSNLSSNSTFAATNLTVSGNAMINLISTSAEGSFAKSDNIDITASTDSSSGYKLIIQATDSTYLVSGSNSIASLDPGTSISEETFANGSYNGKWGFKPSMFNSVANSSFLSSPSTTGDIINTTACANGTTNCPNETDNYTISIGAKVSNTQPPGSYSNTFNIIMINNGVDYSVTYRTNQVSNMPEDVNGETESSTITLSSETPTRDGYTFLGWCTVQPAADGTCSGTSYAAGATVSTSTASNLSLYARWGASTNKTIATATYMQEVTSCPSSLTTGQQYTLIDKRDSKTYTVAKQADGKCWMTQNLDLDIGNTAVLTSENTNLNISGSGSYVVGYRATGNMIAWAPIDKTITTGRAISGTTVTGWVWREYSPWSIDGGDVYVYTSNSTSTDTVYTSLSSCKSAHSESDCKHYHVGNYYNWSAAVASNDNSSMKTQYATAQNDICPKGWRLPVGRSSETISASTVEYAQLFYTSGVKPSLEDTSTFDYTSNGFNKIRSAPLYFVRGGWVGDEVVGRADVQGYYSSSSRDSATTFHHVSARPTNGSIYSYTSNPDQYGDSVRCVLR